MENSNDKELEDLVIRLYRAGAEEETAFIISAMVRRPGGRKELISWLDAHQEASLDDIQTQAEKIMEESMR